MPALSVASLRSKFGNLGNPRSMDAVSRRAVCRAFIASGAILLPCPPAHGQTRSTPTNVLETSRILGDAIDISPGGTRYVFRVVRVHPETDTTQIHLFSGQTTDLLAAEPRLLNTFSTSGKGRPDCIAGAEQDSFRSPLQWIDEDRIAFLLSDADGVRQINECDLRSGQRLQLTRSGGAVFSFAVTPDRAILYQAQMPPRDRLPANFADRGVTIGPQTDGWAALEETFNGESNLDRAWNTQWFYVDPSAAQPRPVQVANGPIDYALPGGRVVSLSKNGRRVLVSIAPREVPDSWLRYGETDLRIMLAFAQQNLLSFNGRRAWCLAVVDLNTGRSRPLWDAPLNIFSETVAAWAPDDQRVFLANTFLPGAADNSDGQRGTAVAVIDVATGAFEQVDLDNAVHGTTLVKSVEWREPHKIQIIASTPRGDITLEILEANGVWATATQLPARPRVGFEVRQSLTSPPILYGVAPNRERQRALFHTNPGVSHTGRVEIISGGTDPHLWSAHIMYPPGFRRGTRYPLLVQGTPGRASVRPDVFTLTGDQVFAPMGPPAIAGYPGQDLTGEGVIVATLGAEGDLRTYAEAWRLGVEELVGILDAQRAIDPNRVGLAGFSSMGYVVARTLTHSTVRYRAAATLDNYDASYVQTAFSEWDRANDDIGAAPFGEGLATWLREATGFNVERITAALLLQAHSMAAVVGNWEVFGRLRHLGRPVEMYVMPDAIAHPAHSPQNPSQIRALRSVSTDWFAFWLAERIDNDPAKAEQYDRWNALRG